MRAKLRAKNALTLCHDVPASLRYQPPKPLLDALRPALSPEPHGTSPAAAAVTVPPGTGKMAPRRLLAQWAPALPASSRRAAQQASSQAKQQATTQRPTGRPMVPRRDAHSGLGSGGASPRRRPPCDWSAPLRVTCCQENCLPEFGAVRGAAVRDGAGLALRELGRGQGKWLGEMREKIRRGGNRRE